MKERLNILVTGANGQLATTLKAMVKDTAHGHHWVFMTKAMLDITSKTSLETCFKEQSFDVCINTAAYTKVDQAEDEKEKAYLVNATGVHNLALECQKHGSKLIHISTDYVFDGSSNEPYKETDNTGPINVYGASKLQGEHLIQEVFEAFYIVRASWLYSQYGQNFFTTIKSYLEQGKALQITTAQKGVPTSCVNLSKFLIWLLHSEMPYGIYHFSDHGEATWYEFALEIAECLSSLKTKLIAPTAHYPTRSERPEYSVLSNSKRCQSYPDSPHWKLGIKQTFENINR